MRQRFLKFGQTIAKILLFLIRTIVSEIIGVLIS